MKVQFTESCAGLDFSFSAGQEVTQAETHVDLQAMVDANFAVCVDPGDAVAPQIETATAEPAAETATTKKPRRRTRKA